MSDRERQFPDEFGPYLTEARRDPRFDAAYHRAQRRTARGDLARRMLTSLWVKVFLAVLSGFTLLILFIAGAVWTNQHLGDTACLIYLIVGVAAIVATCVVALKALVE